MIKAVRCDQESFRDVEFKVGLNVILAERADTSTGKDSRNGLGKSTLIEIIHYCLGSQPRKDGGIFSVKVLGWTYSLDMVIQGYPLTVSRSTSEPNRVRVISPFDYNTADLADPTLAVADKVPHLFDDEETDAGLLEVTLAVENWREFLGKILFDTSPDTSRNYQPTFRSLISYVIRTGKDAYTVPFEHHRKQVEWDKQVNNAFLLGLAWEDASDLQEKRDEKKDLDARTLLLARELQGNPKRMLGQLEANRVQLQQKLFHEERAINNFQVHPQYRDINALVDRLTEEIHELVNANVADSQVADLYRTTDDVGTVDLGQLARLYEEVGVVFPQLVQRRLIDVEEFHQQVVRNRRNFLAAEIERLDRQIATRTRQIEEKSRSRARNMDVLKTHGALSEYNRIQGLFLDAQANLNLLETQIRTIRGLEQRMSQFRIELEHLQQRMREDYDERIVQRDRAIAAFNSNSELIYDVQGTLIINVTEGGFKFDVIIKRDGSDGIGNMKVFCYDLMLAELWAAKPKSPGFLIHDSIIFDGVDERQVKNALELAANTSADQNFQYICTLNSDNVPWNEFSPDFKLLNYVRLTLTDDTEEGGLLGVRF